jgi:RecB family endonuclease NucS
VSGRFGGYLKTNFGIEGIMERKDIQRLLSEQISVLDESLMVIAEEFGDWLDSSRRIDLLCIDSDANLVVVELKRTEDGGLMELQALRYAAMVSAMTFSSS